MNSLYADAVLPHRVSPFGYLRIEAYLQLPEAFRSLSRPSSAPDAKAFPLRSFLLDLPLRLPPQLSNNKRDGPILVLFRFELCRLICFTNKIVITHFVEACFVSFAAEQAHRLIHSAASPLDFEPACAGLQNRKVKMFSLLLPSHNLHQMSQCSVFKVHRVSASSVSFAAEHARRLIRFAALPFAP